MADLHDLYTKFDEKITLTAAKKESLRTGRNALREKIKDAFAAQDRRQPKFRMQGSFAMHTTVNPIGDNEYDLDDGVYLQGYEELDREDWPSPKDTHQWLVDAVDGHTKSDPEDKTSCVRVRYEADYHIDFPVYIIQDGTCFLASTKEGWTESDPKAFTDWFVTDHVVNDPRRYGEQLRRTVRYLKAWRDYCGVDLESIVLTILATEHFSVYAGRDDLAVRNTLENIYNALCADFSCKKPVTPGDELLSDRSEDEQQAILDALKSYLDAAKSAQEETDEKKASELLRTVYGTRFPLGETAPCSSDYAATAKPGVIGNDSRSA